MQSLVSIIVNVESRAAVILAVLCLAACGNKLQTREAVERGIRKGVEQRGLNLNAMDVHIQNLSFHENKADATVGFFPKGGQLSQGMTMHYTLEQRENEWVIVGRSQADMSQHSGGMQPGGTQPGGSEHGSAPPIPVVPE